MTMRKVFRAAALLAVGVAVTGDAQARGYRNGTVNTPFGSFNTNSPEYRAAGGDPFAAERIREQMMMQKMMQQQMQMEAKAQAEFAKRMKDPKFRAAYEAEQQRVAQSMAAMSSRKKKKKHTLTPTQSSAKEVPAKTDGEEATTRSVDAKK